MHFNKYKDEHFWTSNLNSPLFHAWSGYAFEILCLNHVSQIKHALGISGIQSNACCWSCKDTQGGSQIDLLIDRSDNVVSVCEMKYSRNEYEITKAEAENFMNKIDKLMLHTKTKKSIRFTMVTLSGLKQNKYSYIAQNQVDIKNIINL